MPSPGITRHPCGSFPGGWQLQETEPRGHGEPGLDVYRAGGSASLSSSAQTGCRPQTNPVTSLGLSFPICHWGIGDFLSRAHAQGGQMHGLWNQNSRF